MIRMNDERRIIEDRIEAEPIILPKGRFGWILLSVWLFTVVLAGRYAPRLVSQVDLNLYLLQPLLWISVGLLALKLLNLSPAKLWAATGSWQIRMAAMVGLFQVSALVLSGLLVGFGKSPYSHSFWLTLLNIWFVLTRLAGMELARWYLMRHFQRRSLILGVFLAWLILTLANLPLTALGSGPFDLGELFRLIGNNVLPTASTHALATYLMLNCGPLASFTYLSVLTGFEWLSPILPDMEWTLNAFIGTVIPILAVLFVHDILEWRADRVGAPAPKSGSLSAGWVLLSVLIVFLLWFNSGLFGVRPTLISGISMEPAIKPGDIVITREVTPGEVKQGDVVLFSDGKRSILHRVIEIRNENGSQIFLTQGDNVDKMDEPWEAEQLKGKLVLVIPKLGWVSFGIKRLFGGLF